MAFFVAADAYDAFMGRYSKRLAVPFADFAGVEAGQRVLDVGCGPGALTAELVRRLGAANVAAADPSEPFVTAARERFPEVDVRVAPAERLPFADGEFDATLAQLVVHFMSDPVAGIAEMARVTRPGGTVAACVWDIDGARAPLSPVWTAAARLGLGGNSEAGLVGVGEGQLQALFEAAGLTEVEGGEVGVAVEHESFDEWWRPFLAGVGPVGAFIQRLEPEQVAALGDDLRSALGDPPTGIPAVAWAARGRVASSLR